MIIYCACLKNIEESLSSIMPHQNEGMIDNKDSDIIIYLLNENKTKIDEVIHLIDKHNDGKNKRDTTIITKKANDGITPIIQEIQSIGYQPLRELTQTEWKEIEHYWEKTHSILAKKLIMLNNINKREYHICILTMMGVPTSSTAILMGCTMAALSMSKKRLLEKLTGKTESGRDLMQFLRSLDNE